MASLNINLVNPGKTHFLLTLSFMKKILSFLFALSALNSVTAQGCFPEGITFTNQTQIDNFQSDYPGCSLILGDVNIIEDGSEIITNLDGLTAMQRINGNLLIKENYDLVSITGLQNLTFVGGNLSLQFNYTLPSLTGLENLDSIGGDFVTGCTNLITDLEALGNLTYIGGDIDINWHPNLVSLHGLENLNHLGGGITLSNNVILTDLSPLESITTLNGSLFISCVHSLVNLEGLNNLMSIEGDLDINWCDDLSNFTGLEKLTSIAGNFIIDGNGYLDDLSGLNSLKSVGGTLSIIYNDDLYSLTGLDSLSSIGGNLTIGGNGSLTSLAGLDNIAAATITGLIIEDNSWLSTCNVKSVCEYLASPGAVVNISGNYTGCDNPQEVENSCITGNAEELADGNFSLFPNPSGREITIKFPSNQIKNEVCIINSGGQQLINLEIKGNSTKIDISYLPIGVYFVKLTGNNGFKMIKFIKE
jgi:hypothetical protein